MAEQHIQPILEGEDDLDLLKLTKVFWNGRVTFLICLLAGTIMGIYVAISTPKEYTATTIMVPQMGGKGQAQLSGLAAIAGINFANDQSSEISPIIYPKIINSVPFKLELMEAVITSRDFNQPVSLFDYYNRKRKTSVLNVIKKYTIGLPGVIVDAFSRKQQNLGIQTASSNQPGELNQPIQPIQLTGAQYGVKGALDGALSLGLDAKQGFITLSVRMPEALAAAQVAQIAQDLLQRHITEFKIRKAKADLDFIQERYSVAKAEAEKYQVNVAVNTDRVKNFTSNLPQVENVRVQNQYAIANTVFQDLARQLEQAKIQVKKDTPVFTIIEPVSVPIVKSKPNPPTILFMWIFLGGFVGVILIFGKHYLPVFRKKWAEVE